MSTLDDIAQERQRLAERVARLDSERGKLAEQLAELEAAERVFARFDQPRPAARGRGRPAAAVEGAGRMGAPRRGRTGRRTADAAQDASLSLGDATLRAVAAHAQGVSSEAVRSYLAEQLGMPVRPNHLGMALQRHRRAGRLELRDQLWFSPAPA